METCLNFSAQQLKLNGEGPLSLSNNAGKSSEALPDEGKALRRDDTMGSLL
jgi:hypothetical protein